MIPSSLNRFPPPIFPTRALGPRHVALGLTGDQFRGTRVITGIGRLVLIELPGLAGRTGLVRQADRFGSETFTVRQDAAFAVLDTPLALPRWHRPGHPAAAT